VKARHLPPPGILIAVITAMTAVSSASNAQYLPSLPGIAIDMATTPAMVQLTLSVFMVAYALAQLVWGPLADRYGRRPMLLAGLGLYVASSVACAAANSIEALIAFRLLQALAACAAPVLARAVVRDLYELKDAARVMAYVSAAFSLAPVLSPILGAFLEQNFGWRSNFVFMMGFGALVFAAVWLILPETQRHRAAPIHALRIARDYVGLFAHRKFTGYTLCIACGFGQIFVFNSVAPFYFIDVIGLRPTGFALVYGAVTVGFGGGAYLAARVTPRLGIDRTILTGTLLSLCAGLILAALVGWAVGGVAGIIAPMIVVGLGSGLVMPNSQAGAIAPFPMRAGAASAMVGFMQMAVAAAGGVVAIHVYDGTPRVFAFGVAALAVAMLACFWGVVMRSQPEGR
jgi:MFS transporter, DHA1 family, multidrug resistance protein